MIKRIPNRLTARFLPGWAVNQVVKPAVTSRGLKLGQSAALDENIVAVGEVRYIWGNKADAIVYVFNISTNPAQQLTILSIWHGIHSSRVFGMAVAVSRKHGILVGSAGSDVGSMFEVELSFSLDD